MQTLRLSLLLLHFIGLALLLGGFLTQLPIGGRRITTAMLLGAITMAVTGPALATVRHSLELPVLDAKIAAKATIVAAVATAAVIGWLYPRRPAWAFQTVGVLTLANLAIAVFWR